MNKGWKLAWFVVPVVVGAWGAACSSGPATNTNPDGGGVDAATKDVNNTHDAVNHPGDTGVPCTGTVCNGSCTNTKSDNANCGACGKACSVGQVCSAGSCSVTCASPLTTCGSGSTAACTDTQNDPSNCGTCGKVCGQGETCNSGTCGIVCPTPESLCGSSCVNEQTDLANCGKCSNPCSAGQVCSGGSCVATCGPPETVCGGADAGVDGGAAYCSDLQTDFNNCGNCGKACATGANAVPACSGGVCGLLCNPGYANCDVSPTDGCEVHVTVDPSNCGSCGNVCASKVCLTGTCALVGNVLLYVDDDDTVTSAAVSALGGMPIVTTNDTDFGTAFTAGGFSMIIIDSAYDYVPADIQTQVESFIAGGGYVIVSYWDLEDDPTGTAFATALGVTASSEFTTPVSAYDDPTSPFSFFTGPVGMLASPLTFNDNVDVDGQDLAILTAAPGSFIAADFGMTGGPGALTVTFAGKIITNGFSFNEFASATDGQTLIENEIAYELSH
jgi:hypothetical protein